MATNDVDSAVENKHQKRNRESTRAMLDAVAELIAEGGLDAVTLVAVGERSGYSRGLASARFGSKAAMIAALVDMISGRWRERAVLPSQRGRSGLDGLCAFIDALWKQMDDDETYVRVLYTLMFEAVGGPRQAVREEIAVLQREQIDGFARLFERGVDDGSIRPDVDVRAQAALLSAELRGVAYQWMIDPDHTDAISLLRMVRETLIDRVATAP